MAAQLPWSSPLPRIVAHARRLPFLGLLLAIPPAPRLLGFAYSFAPDIPLGLNACSTLVRGCRMLPNLNANEKRVISPSSFSVTSCGGHRRRRDVVRPIQDDQGASFGRKACRRLPGGGALFVITLDRYRF